MLRDGGQRQSNRRSRFRLFRREQPEPGLESSEDFSPPEPRSIVDEEHARKLAAATHVVALIERQGVNRQYHARRARRVFRGMMRAAAGRVTAVRRQLGQLRSMLRELKERRTALPRFIGMEDDGSPKNPATGWEYLKFCFLLLLLLLAFANGTLTVSSVMQSTPAFEGSTLKTISVGFGLFLLPSLGSYLPFFLIAHRRRRARTYLLLLTGAGMCCFVVFGITWSYSYALETGNDLLLDLTTIGLGGDEVEDEEVWWLFANAGWLQLLANILGDAAFAGSAKGGMSLLAQNYALFRRKARQENPEWRRLFDEEAAVVREIADREGEEREAEEQLAAVEDEQSDFVGSVCALADGVLLQEVDRVEAQRLELEGLQRALETSEDEAEKKRQALYNFTFKNPGVYKGEGDES